MTLTQALQAEVAKLRQTRPLGLIALADGQFLALFERERAGHVAAEVMRSRGANWRRVKRERNKAMRAIPIPPAPPLPEIDRTPNPWWRNRNITGP